MTYVNYCKFQSCAFLDVQWFKYSLAELCAVSQMSRGKDLDFFDLGGDLTWLPPNDTEHLDAYLVYLAEGHDGKRILRRLTRWDNKKSCWAIFAEQKIWRILTLRYPRNN